jgi:hypothetical protein
VTANDFLKLGREGGLPRCGPWTCLSKRLSNKIYKSHQDSRNIPRIKKTVPFHQDNVNLLLRCRNPEVQLANMEVERKVIDLTKVSRGGTKEILH